MSHLKAQYLQGFQGFEKTFLPNFYQKAVKINLERDSVSRVDCFDEYQSSFFAFYELENNLNN